jgi:hypothetical protein
MPFWTTVYLRGDDRQRMLSAAGLADPGDGEWSESSRRRVHSYAIRRVRERLVRALREACESPDEAEEQLLLTACFAACNHGPSSILNTAVLYDTPMRAALSELRLCIGEGGYDEAIGYMGQESIYEQILGAILQDDAELAEFMASRFPEPLI